MASYFICANCGWENSSVRKSCKNCRRSLADAERRDGTRSRPPGGGWTSGPFGVPLALPLRLPDHLPWIVGLLTLGLVGAHQVGPLLGPVLGRPSSTAAVGVMFAWMTAPVLALGAGFLAAFAVSLGVRRLAPRFTTSRIVPNWVTAGTAALTLLFSVSVARDARAAYEQSVEEREFLLRPRVIVASERIVRRGGGPDERVEGNEAPLVYESLSDESLPTIEWNGRSVRVSGEGGFVTVMDAEEDRLASSDLTEFDYMRTIRATPFCADRDGRRALAAYVQLRATAGRDMFLVFAPDGTVEYQEHLERTGPSSDQGLFVERSAESERLFVDHGRVSAYECGLEGSWDEP